MGDGPGGRYPNDAWEDFHHRFITHAADVLNAQVGDKYLVKVQVRLLLHELSAEERRFFGIGDLGVTPSAGGVAVAKPTTAASAPLELFLPNFETEEQGYIEIRDRRNRRVVTVIELLSPTNKTPGPDQFEYLGKRNAVLASPTHLVEIDLRRGGKRPAPLELPPCDYSVLVSRYEERPRVGVWLLSVRDKLPTIPIPLAEPDPDVSLDLQAVVQHVYDLAGYAKYIYSEAPNPPLSGDDAAWAEQIMANRGRP